jgi:hypothetical protein
MNVRNRRGIFLSAHLDDNEIEKHIRLSVGGTFLLHQRRNNGRIISFAILRLAGLLVLLFVIIHPFASLSSWPNDIPIPPSRISMDVINQRDHKMLTIFAQSGSKLIKKVFPHKIDCTQPYLHFPINVDEDPYLPWIHDYFIMDSKLDGTLSVDGDGRQRIQFIAQNRRRCETGKGKEDVMKFWEPQMALFQPVAIRVLSNDSRQIALVAPEDNATHPETRFICRFHDFLDVNLEPIHGTKILTTFSDYSFNYEFINWRKRGDKPMFVKTGPDVEIFDYATLLFSCPIPNMLQAAQFMLVDLIPIRTPARYDEGYMLTKEHVGDIEFEKLHRFNTTKHYGNKALPVPPLEELGRYENIPVCRRPQMHNKTRLTACTWAAASYKRRGGKISVDDAPKRLKEWLIFHRLVGYDRIVVYDNTQGEELPFKAVADSFPEFVTYIQWPGTAILLL